MKKIVRQQNYLKELIESQKNRLLSKQALNCLVKSVLEPVLDAPEEGVVLHRIENADAMGLKGHLRRLEYSDIESYSYTDDSGNLIEKVWANTEFICVLTHRYVAVIIWENNPADKEYVKYYSLYNSRLQYEPLDIIKRNSKVNIAPYQEKFNPDRRDNVLLNSSIRKLLGIMEEAATDAVLGYAEQSAKTLAQTDYASKKSGVVAHEIRNQLSICDLYTEILKKSLKTKPDDAVVKALNTISKALKMANNTLSELKNDNKIITEKVSLKEIIESAYELSKVYCENKKIDFEIEMEEDVVITADKDKLISILINLIKNATEAFDEKNINGKYIKLKTENENGYALISVSDNAAGINEPERIFNEGYTTKSTGSGLGLWVCKKSAEEIGGELELSRTAEDYTEFVLKLPICV